MFSRTLTCIKLYVNQCRSMIKVRRKCVKTRRELPAAITENNRQKMVWIDYDPHHFAIFVPSKYSVFNNQVEL